MTLIKHSNLIIVFICLTFYSAVIILYLVGYADWRKRMAKSEANEEKKKVIRRLRRIEGQIRGLQRMIEEGGYCEDVLIQLSAVKSAIESLSVAVMESYLKHCFVKEGIIHPEKKQELEQALKVLKRLK